MSVPLIATICVLAGYLIGSIPFGVIAASLGGVGDIRKVGSGSIGATNVLRTGRKDLALITVLGDGGKGALAVLIGWLFTPHGADAAPLMAMAGGAAFFGHLYSVFLKFTGGKGVATFFGVLLSIAWPVGLLAGATWLVMAFLFRISSLAGLTTAVLAPVYVLALKGVSPFGPYPILLLTVFMAVLIFIKHHQNIRRLLKGEEPKIGAKKTA